MSYKGTIKREDLDSFTTDLDSLLESARLEWPEKDLYSVSTGWIGWDECQTLKFKGAFGDVSVRIV